MLKSPVPNELLIIEFSNLIARTQTVINYYKEHKNPNSVHLEFKLIAYKKALEIISSAKHEIESGTSIMHHKGIGNGIANRIDLILKHKFLPDEYANILPHGYVDISPDVQFPELKVPEVKVPVQEVKVPEVLVPVQEVKVPEVLVPVQEVKVPEVPDPVQEVKVPEVLVPIQVFDVKVPEIARMFNVQNVPRVPEYCKNEPTEGKARSRYISNSVVDRLITQNEYLIQNLISEHKEAIKRERELAKIKSKCDLLELLYLEKNKIE
uniref:DNA polymerase beta-like N-terminal domain-containing protein n=1 Tax=viral metagenome TaxID=1070528 RepID=A0A6C0E947_9ZZZZ